MTQLCPDKAEWSNFVAGIIPPAEIDALADHLDDCAACQATVRQAHAGDDTLVALLRRPPVAGPYDHEPQLRHALRRVADSLGTASDLNAPGGASLAEALALVGDVPPALPAAAPAKRTRPFGPYEIIEELGRGGMGVVYKALQPHLDRLVAIKILPGGRLRDPAAVARFKREMKAVGKLNHPNIVRAYDGGEVEGEHYLAIEYLEGVDLSRLVARLGALPLADACELIRQAAVGLEHARSHKMVHRDIKPANLMLSTAGQVKILDLGLAMLAEHGLADDLTASDQLMGTLDYLAPEQAEDSHAVDIRADIYSLGCTFYKLLTGDAPFRGPKCNTPIKKILAHARSHPEPLCQRRPDVPDAVADIVRRMMAKAPQERFDTPAEVAAALVPFTTGSNLVVLMANCASARPGAASGGAAALTETFGKSAYDGTHPNHLPAPQPTVAPPTRRPRRRFITAAAAAALVLLAAIAIIIKDRHGDELARVEAPAAASAMIEVKPLAPPKPAGPKQPSSDSAATKPPPAVATDPIGPGGLAAAPVPIDGLKGWNLVTRDALVGEADAVFHPTEPIVATAGPDGVIRFRDAKTFEVRRAWIASANWIEHLAWSPDGRRLATLARSSPEVTVWDYPAGKKAYVLSGHHGDINDVVFSPDGALIGTAAFDSTLRIWDAADGRARQVIPLPNPSSLTLSWNSDGKRIATFQPQEKVIRLWDAGSGKALKTISCTVAVNTGEWQPGTSLLAVHGDDHVVRVIDVDQPNVEERPLVRATDEVPRMAWSPDGKRLALAEMGAGYRFVVSVWDAATGKSEGEYRFSVVPARVHWSADSQTVAAGGFFNDSRSIAIFEVSKEHAALAGVPARIARTNSNFAWHPTSLSTGAVGIGNTIRLWDFDEHREKAAVQCLNAPPCVIEWSPDGKLLACLAYDGRLALCDAATRQLLDSATVDPKGQWPTWFLGWAKDGCTIVTATHAPGSVRLWSVSSGRLSARDVHVELGKGPFAVSAAADLLATQQDDGAMTLIWDIASAELRRRVPGAATAGCAWSPDTRRLAVSTGRQVSVIDTVGGEPAKSFFSFSQYEWWEPLRWSPDGKYLAAAGERFTHVCEVAAPKRPYRWSRHAGRTERLSWSPDKPYLTTSSPDETVRFWDISRGVPLGMFLRRNQQLVAIGINGHVRGGGEEEFLYVALTDKGQETLTQAEFAAEFGWKNNLDEVRLLDFDGSPASGAAGRLAAAKVASIPSPSGATPVTGKDAVGRSVDDSPDNSTTSQLGPAGFVGHPPAIAGLRGWNIVKRGSANFDKHAVFHPKEPIVATAGAGGLIRICDAATLAVRRVMMTPGGEIENMAWSPDGTTLATVDNESVRLWQFASGRLLHPLDGRCPGGRDLLIQFSPDGTLLATGGRGRPLQLWGVGDAGLRKTFAIPDGVVSLAWDAAGRRLAVHGARDRELQFIDVIADAKEPSSSATHDRAKSAAPRGLSPGSSGCAWSADGTRIAYKADDGALRVYDANSLESLGASKWLEGDLLDLAWSPNGQFLAAGYRDPDVCCVGVCDASTLKVVREYKTTTTPRHVCWSPDSANILASGIFNEFAKVSIWDVDRDDALLPERQPQPLYADEATVAWAPGALRFAIGVGGRVEVWDAATCAQVETYSSDGGLPLRMAWSPDGSKLAAATREHRFVLWNASTHNLLDSVAHQPSRPRLAWLSDGDTLVTNGGDDDSIQRWHTKDGRLQPLEPLTPALKGALAVAPNRGQLAALTPDWKEIAFYDLTGGKLLRGVPTAECHDLAWSECRDLVAETRRFQCLLHDPAGKMPSRSLAEPFGDLIGVAWSPTGEQIAGACRQSGVVLWDVASGEVRRTLYGHDRLVWSTTWSPDGRVLASHGTTRFWNPANGRLWGTLLRVDDEVAVIGSNGHVRASQTVIDQLAYVALTDAGQETLTQTEFEAKFSWKNDPDKVRMIDFDEADAKR